MKISAKIIFKAAVWALWAIVLVASILTAQSVSNSYLGISLRFAKGFSQKEADGARRYAASLPEDEPGVWFTYWVQEKANFESDLKTQKAECLFFDGSAEYVMPAKFLQGEYPGALDDVGCAVSSKLAWQMWQSENVVGNILKVNDEEYIVRGVFKSEEELALVSYAGKEYKNQWHAAETQSSKSLTTDEAAQLAAKAGFSEPDSVILGTDMRVLAKMAVWLPITLMVFCGFFALLKLGKSKNRKEIIVFAFFLLVAIVLPQILAVVPLQFLPSKWSDFSFWALLRTDLQAQMKEFLGMTPFTRDIEAKILLIKQAGVFFASLFLVPILVKPLFVKKKQNENAKEVSEISRS